MKRWAILAYGVFSYALFHAVFLYAVLFIGNLFISNSLDGEPRMSLLPAILINLGLLTAFAIQHSGMARQPFKDWLTKFIPESAERSTFVLMSNVAMILLFAFWQPLGGSIWMAESQIMIVGAYALYFTGWAIVLYATFAICHFDLFGLRQVWMQFRGQPYKPHVFRIPAVYKIVRHPLYVGWLMITWATPTMTVSHLVFAIGITGYILAAIQLEERDLIRCFGSKYSQYRKSVPMLIPRFFRTAKTVQSASNPIQSMNTGTNLDSVVLDSGVFSRKQFESQGD
jgi:protein-S-isoprenylcysteine O-methyltransferase Ste14